MGQKPLYLAMAPSSAAKVGAIAFASELTALRKLDWFDATIDFTALGHYFRWGRSEEHTSELQSQSNLVCRLLLEKKNKKDQTHDGEPDGQPERRAPDREAAGRDKARDLHELALGEANRVGRLVDQNYPHADKLTQ